MTQPEDSKRARLLMRAWIEVRNLNAALATVAGLVLFVVASCVSDQLVVALAALSVAANLKGFIYDSDLVMALARNEDSAGAERKTKLAAALASVSLLLGTLVWLWSLA